MSYEDQKHQERTERAAQGQDPRNESSGNVALWQIAHSLAAIADALEEPTGFESVTGPPKDADDV